MGKLKRDGMAPQNIDKYVSVCHDGFLYEDSRREVSVSEFLRFWISSLNI
jgi:hypothetical protein